MLEGSQNQCIIALVPYGRNGIPKYEQVEWCLLQWIWKGSSRDIVDPTKEYPKISSITFLKGHLIPILQVPLEEKPIDIRFSKY